ncbi:MAG: Ig-like domain-containing protein [Gemmatimonadales bacterium]
MRINYTSSIAAVTCTVLAACGGGGGGGGNGTPTQPPGGGATPVLTTITISAPSTTVSASPPTAGTIQLSASPKDQFGSAINANITWSSSAPTIADVNVSGLVTAISAGSANAIATSGSVSASTTITVTGGGAFPLQGTVNMPANTFTPGQIDIAVAGVVSFVFPADDHNVIFTSGTGRPSDIQVIHGTTVTRQFNAKGAFPFVCTLHPGMAATVVVH